MYQMDHNSKSIVAALLFNFGYGIVITATVAAQDAIGRDARFRPRIVSRPSSAAQTLASGTDEGSEPAPSEDDTRIVKTLRERASDDAGRLPYAPNKEAYLSHRAEAPPAPTGANASQSLPARFSAQDPFRDDPLPTVSVTATPSTVGGKDDQRASLGVMAQPQINLQELRSRVVGFDRGLRDVESKLLPPTHLNAPQLMRLAEVLDDLVRQRDFVELYLLNLSTSQRKSMPVLRSPDIAMRMLSDQVVEHRHALRRGAHGTGSVDRQRDLLLLQQVQRKLTDLGLDLWPE